MDKFLTCLIGLNAMAWPLSYAGAQAPPAPAGPSVTILLGTRHGHATPTRQGFSHTGGGNMDVAQPTPDTVVITVTGVAVAGGHPTKDSVASLAFDLVQDLEVTCSDPKVRKAKVNAEARVIGLLRSHSACVSKKGCAGTAEISAACITLTDAKGQPVSLSLSGHAVGAGENLSVNDHEGPTEASLAPGKYTLHQSFVITATHPRGVFGGKAASAEFAPDPALDPLWISYFEPFHGANKKDFGLQVVLKVSAN